MRLNHGCVIAGRCCICGVVGFVSVLTAVGADSKKSQC